VAWQAFDSGGRPIPEQAGRADGFPVWGVPAVVALSDDTFRLFY
jgi:hypothetical protein